MSQGHEPIREDAPEVAFELRDVSWRKVLLMFTGICAVLIALHVIVTYMFFLMAGRTRYTTEPFGEPAQQMFQQLQELQQHERQVLTSYGWVSRDERIVRIPIDRAMDLVAAEYSREESR